MRILRSTRRFLHETQRYFAAGRVRPVAIFSQLRGYRWDDARADTKAALNVTVLAVAQAIAFAAIAGLPVVCGVLSTAVAALVAPLFASSRHTVLGPTNATALMFYSYFLRHPEMTARYGEVLPLLVFMVGFFAAAAALLRVADLMQFVSRSVLVGYVSGAAVLILVNQSVHFLGVADRIDKNNAESFVGFMLEVFKSLPRVDAVEMAVGVTTMFIFYTLRWWKPKWPVFAITLLLVSVVSGVLISQHVAFFSGVTTFKSFSMQDLAPRIPPFFREGVFNDISALLSVALALAFLASLENTLMAKALASKSGDNSDVNQDMYAVGMANMACAVAGGMAASGSLTRSQLNFESGARTGMASLLSGVFSLGFAVFLAASREWGVPLIDFVPKSALAALVIALSFSLFNAHHIRICLRSTRDDSVVLLATFVSALLAPLHVAIFIGVAVSISLFLRKASKPHLEEYEFSDRGELRAMGEKRQRPIPAISIVHVEGDLFFGASELFRTQIQRTVSDPAIRVIILRLKNARHLDATSVMALEELIRFMREKGLHLIVSGATRDVYRVLKQSGVLETVQEGCDRRAGESNLFMSHARNPNLSTRAALKRAQQLIGEEKADIRIFYDPSKHQESKP